MVMVADKAEARERSDAEPECSDEGMSYFSCVWWCMRAWGLNCDGAIGAYRLLLRRKRSALGWRWENCKAN